MKVDVSILVLVYNHEKYLSKALDSISSQEHDLVVEVIIGNDNSPDGSLRIIENFCRNNKNAKLIICPINRTENLGGCENLNDLFLRASGKYVTFLEGDDYWFDTNKLRTQYEFLESNLGVKAVSHPLRVEDINGNKLFNTPVPHNGKFELNQYLRGERFSVTATMFRYNENEVQKVISLLSAGPRNTGDTTLSFYFLSLGPIYILSKPMAVYNMRSIAGESNYNSSSSGLTKCNDRLKLLILNDEYYKLGKGMSYLYLQMIQRVLISYQLSVSDQKQFFKLLSLASWRFVRSLLQWFIKQ